METKQLSEYIFLTMCMIDFLCVGIWEITLVTEFQDNKLVSEYSAFNFTFACSAINIINSITLLWLIFNKFIISNYIILYIMNIIIGILSISLYNSIYVYGNFYNVIITEMIMFYIKCIIAIIFGCNKMFIRERYNILDTSN